MLREDQRRFLEGCRVAHLATADAHGVPHVVPVCFAVDGAALYIAIDEKPKSGPAASLKRLRNIAENPAVAVVADRYAEDWRRLGWVLLRGRAEILTDGDERDAAYVLLRRRYPQYAGMRLTHLPLIAVRIARATSWGTLDGDA